MTKPSFDVSAVRVATVILMKMCVCLECVLLFVVCSLHSGVVFAWKLLCLLRALCCMVVGFLNVVLPFVCALRGVFCLPLALFVL